MRKAFFAKLHEAMKKDEKIFFLMGDTGLGLVEPLFEEFPDRVLNTGIAEQDLIGVSAGLANAGYKPVCYAISNFLVHRCLEQVRNDLCLHNYPVVMAGTSVGFENGGLWATHYVVDDIGCLKPLPNIAIYSPGSVESLEKVFDEAIGSQNPSYIRMMKQDFSDNQPEEGINRWVIKNEKSKILVISHGKMIKNLWEANQSASVFSLLAMNKIKPLEEKLLKDSFTQYEQVLVVEDNFKSGLFNSICQFIAENNLRVNVRFAGPAEDYGTRIGDAAYLEEINGLSPQKLAQTINNLKNE